MGYLSFLPADLQGQQLLFLVLAVNSLGIGLVTLIYVRSVDQRGALRLWAASQVVLASGLLPLATRTALPEQAELVAGMGLIFLGLAMQLSAYYRYALFRTSTNWIESILALGLLGLLFLGAMFGNRGGELLTSLFVIAMAQLAFVGVLVLSSRPRTALLNTLIAAHAASAMAFMAMALDRLREPMLAATDAEGFSGFVLSLAGLFPYVAGLSFLFLIKEDSDRELRLSQSRIDELRQQQEETERLHRQRLRESELETMAHLSAGVAHDFNNLLGVIENDTHFLEYRLRHDGQDASTLDAIENIQSALGQARIVTSGMMVLNRDTQLVLERIPLDPVLAELARVLKPMLPEGIVLEVQMEPGLVVASSRGFLQATLLNFATNARDAMPEGGRLVIRASRSPQSPDATRVLGNLDAGEKILIEVEDSGTGIRPEVLERIFEPRFTTKREGAGHGLGLFMVQRFIERSRAGLVVDSLPGRGTIFKLYLASGTRVSEHGTGVGSAAVAPP